MKHVKYFPFVNPHDVSDQRRYTQCVPCFSLTLRNNKDHPAFRAYTKKRKKRRYDISDPLGTICTAFRRAMKAKAMPAWANKPRIAEVYLQAHTLTHKTGVRYQVDHIVPLVSQIVCGLHIPSNLQILTDTENLKKGNRFDTDAVAALMESDWKAPARIHPTVSTTRL